MSLILDAMTRCVFLERSRRPDGVGGYYVAWTEGAEFDAAITFDSSIEARTAEKNGVSSLYTVTTAIGNLLEYHDVFRRLSDGKIFRVTSDGDDRRTPAVATFALSQVSAEEWLPS